MAFGHVKWWNEMGGYGFITSTNGHDILAHYSEIQTDGYPTLEEGQGVEFEVNETPNGPVAANIREPKTPINTTLRPQPLRSATIVHVFQEESLRKLEYEINQWVNSFNYKIISASITNPDGNGKFNAIVVVDRL